MSTVKRLLDPAHVPKPPTYNLFRRDSSPVSSTLDLPLFSRCVSRRLFRGPSSLSLTLQESFLSEPRQDSLPSHSGAGLHPDVGVCPGSPTPEGSRYLSCPPCTSYVSPFLERPDRSSSPTVCCVQTPLSLRLDSLRLGDCPPSIPPAPPRILCRPDTVCSKQLSGGYLSFHLLL